MSLRSKGLTLTPALSGCKLRGISGPDESVEDLDDTVQDSGTAREFLPGSFVDGGEVSVRIRYDPANKPVVGEDPVTQTLGGFSDSSSITFPGYVKRVGHEMELGTICECDVVLKVAGAVTFNTGS